MSKKRKLESEKAKRINVSMVDVVRDRAREIGGGNVSKGLAIAVAQYQMPTN